jgi:hypothetical protein
MDPTASWSASRKVASLLSMWITDHINGDTVTHFDIGPHRTIRDLLADSMQFQRVFMETAHHFHDLVLPATVRIQTAVRKRRRRRIDNEYWAWKRDIKLAASTSSAPSRPTCALARPVVKTMAVQPPRNLPKLLACVRIHDREVRTYELIKRFPQRGLSCKYHTIVFWDEGCTEIKNSTDFAFEADRFQEYRVQDERIAHLIQVRDDQFDRTRRASAAGRDTSDLDDVRLTSALVVIEVNRFARAARVIQQGWRQYLDQRQLTGDEHYDPNNRLCPDGVPGCTCGSEYELAGILDNMWRNHKLGNLTAKAAQVIQQRWQEQRQRRHLQLRRNVFHEMRSPIGLLLPLLGGNKVDTDPPLPDGAVSWCACAACPLPVYPGEGSYCDLCWTVECGCGCVCQCQCDLESAQGTLKG